MGSFVYREMVILPIVSFLSVYLFYSFHNIYIPFTTSTFL